MFEDPHFGPADWIGGRTPQVFTVDLHLVPWGLLETFREPFFFGIFHEKTNAFLPFSEDIVGISWGTGR